MEKCKECQIKNKLLVFVKIIINMFYFIIATIAVDYSSLLPILNRLSEINSNNLTDKFLNLVISIFGWIIFIIVFMILVNNIHNYYRSLSNKNTKHCGLLNPFC